MRQRKYTLPRHTNLARQSSRTGAFLVDVAIFLAFTLVFFYGVFRLILNPVAKPYSDELNQERLNSHLVYKDEQTGAITTLPSDSSFEEYREVIRYYYMNYLTGNVAEPGTGSRLADEKIKLDDGTEVSKSEYYTVSWFNKNILGITVEDPENLFDLLFTYQKVGDTYDKTQLGVPKATSDEIDVRKYMQRALVSTYTYDFNKLSYVVDLSNKANFIYALEMVLSAITGSIITYVVFPLIFKQGRTVGKKVFKLALATSDGYAFENKQLPMRLMPLVIVLLAFLIPIWSDFFILMIIPMTIFLVSFALAMASPKKAALHDFTARTIVVDDKSSIIFENEAQEEMYIAKEDGLPVEQPEASGEEPELRYEK